MSTKAPDVIVNPPSHMVAFTLAEMHVRSWELKARCNRCKTHLRVSLPAMIKTHGPDAIWWGQHPRCPSFDGEKGDLTYWVPTLGLAHASTVDDPHRARSPVVGNSMRGLICRPSNSSRPRRS